MLLLRSIIYNFESIITTTTTTTTTQDNHINNNNTANNKQQQRQHHTLNVFLIITGTPVKLFMRQWVSAICSALRSLWSVKKGLFTLLSLT